MDDLDADRLYGRFLLMMGSSRRLGASKNAINQPQIRITGVFKGADTLSGLIDSGEYTSLPVVDCYLGIELGILNEEFIMSMRKQLPEDEYIRQLLCKNIAAKNLIWEKYIRNAIQVGARIGLEPASPEPFAVYKKRGLISLGYDHTGHGENLASSRSALVIEEQVGNFSIVIFAKTWHPGTDEGVIRKDLVGFWRYFRPDYAIGDAFGIGLLTQVNDDLFAEGLTQIDRRAVGVGRVPQVHGRSGHFHRSALKAWQNIRWRNPCAAPITTVRWFCPMWMTGKMIPQSKTMQIFPAS
ncbi:hypothetical protein P4S72_27220 [Vibrio sp. PP-XX7]